MWTPSSRHMVWSAVSRAIRAPARIDREFYLFIAPGVPFISGGDFKSEEVLAYELGWRVQPHKTLSISLAGFYNQYDNIRTVEPGPPPFGIPVTFGNGVKGTTYGLELSSTCQLTNWWRARGGYTFLEKDLVVKENSSDSNQGSAESNDPQHQFLVQSSMDIRKTISLGIFLRYIGELPEPYVSDYTGLDVRLSWRPHKMFELSVVGQNLMGKSHTEFIPDRPAPKDIERSVYGKIVCTF
jgi:iron complex outermembrane recepter protein